MTPRIWMNAMVAIFGMTASIAHATQTFCVDSVNQFDVAYAAADEENVIIQGRSRYLRHDWQPRGCRFGPGDR
jgi:hypothetical protein